MRTPEVDAGVQPDAEDIRRRPGDEIEVEVILSQDQPQGITTSIDDTTHRQFRRIQYLERRPRDLPYPFPGAQQHPLTLLPYRTQTILLVRHIVQASGARAACTSCQGRHPRRTWRRKVE